MPRSADPPYRVVSAALRERIQTGEWLPHRPPLFDQRGHVETIKRTIALHFVRSLQAPVVHEMIWTKVEEAGRSVFLTSDGRLLEQAFYKKHGLYPVGPLIEPTRERFLSRRLLRADRTTS